MPAKRVRDGRSPRSLGPAARQPVYRSKLDGLPGRAPRPDLLRGLRWSQSGCSAICSAERSTAGSCRYSAFSCSPGPRSATRSCGVSARTESRASNGSSSPWHSLSISARTPTADGAGRPSGTRSQRPRPRTPRSSHPRWWPSSWRTVRSTWARKVWIVPEVALQRVLVDDDAVRVDVAGDGAADVVAVGMVLVTAIGDHHRRVPSSSRNRPANRPAPASRARRTRSGAGREAGATRAPRCDRRAAGIRPRASLSRSAPRSPRRRPTRLATAPASSTNRSDRPANDGGLRRSTASPAIRAVAAAAFNGGRGSPSCKWRLEVGGCRARHRDGEGPVAPAHALRTRITKSAARGAGSMFPAV